MSIKIDRINSNMIKEISYILSTEIKDNDIKFVTVTDVRTTNDLSFAKVYFTVFDETRKNETLKALNNARGYIRRELAGRVDIRHIPELSFVFDESIAYGKKIENLIDKIHQEDKEEKN